jgi:hypothetical protein
MSSIDTCQLSLSTSISWGFTEVPFLLVRGLLFFAFFAFLFFALFVVASFSFSAGTSTAKVLAVKLE